MKQKTSLQRPVYLFSTQLMLNGVKCSCLIYYRPILTTLVQLRLCLLVKYNNLLQSF